MRFETRHARDLVLACAKRVRTKFGARVELHSKRWFQRGQLAAHARCNLGLVPEDVRDLFDRLVDWYRKADPVRSKCPRGNYADDLAALVKERAARVALINRYVCVRIPRW